MAEYIKREEAIETLQRHGIATVIGTYLLERLPAFELGLEPEHGQWITEGYKNYRCSLCDAKEYRTELPANKCAAGYCWNCGARMDGKKYEN